MLETVSAVSLTEGTYDAICSGIVSGRLVPGKRLKIKDLSVQLRVSPSAVREALSRLAAEGLVVLESRKGFSVGAISFEHLNDLTRFRIEVETTCLRFAIIKGGSHWESRLTESAQRLSIASDRADGGGSYLTDDWADVHRDYHAALVDGCDIPWLLRIRAILYSQSERYCRLTMTRRSGRDIRAEHDQLTAAALARNTELACRLLTEHLLRTAEIASQLQQQSSPDPVVPTTHLQIGAP